MPFKEVKQIIGDTDIYLLDQILKGRINQDDVVLDTGCGGGRNLPLLMDNNIDFIAFDPNRNRIEELKKKFPLQKNAFHISSIENFQSDVKFDFIICNAVLHFAKNHQNFQEMFGALIDLLKPAGILFIRMTSDIGIETKVKEISEGVYAIPDGSKRYLLTRKMLDQMMNNHQLQFLNPIKTVNVADQRCMSTWVVGRR